MYPRRRIPPLVLIIGSIVAIVILVWLLGRLDFPGWVLRGLSELVPEGNRTSYTPEEVEDVRNAVGILESENIYLKELIAQLQDEASLEDMEWRMEETLLPANVIYRDHAGMFDTAIINRGSSDGVEVGMPVVEPYGLVGRVVSTRAAISRILLITSPDCSFGVVDQRSREIGVVRGSDQVRWSRGESDPDRVPPDRLELEYLSPSADIQTNDSMITSGLSGITPAGIRVGEVESIVSSAEQGWFKILVRPFADLEHLGTVAVVLYSEEERTQLEEMIEEIGDDAGAPSTD